MVAYDDCNGTIQPLIYYCVSKLLPGFYESYQIGKNPLGKDFPERERESDSYGGNTIWGTKDAIISKYHWTWDYLMWGVSWANVTLMMADSQRTDYDSKRGKSNAEDDEVLDLSDPQNIAKLKKIAR